MQKSSKAYADAYKLRTHLSLALDHGSTPHAYIDLFQYPHDSNHTMNVLLRTLSQRDTLPDRNYGLKKIKTVIPVRIYCSEFFFCFNRNYGLKKIKTVIFVRIYCSEIAFCFNRNYGFKKFVNHIRTRLKRSKFPQYLK